MTPEGFKQKRENSPVCPARHTLMMASAFVAYWTLQRGFFESKQK